VSSRDWLFVLVVEMLLTGTVLGWFLRGVLRCV